MRPPVLFLPCFSRTCRILLSSRHHHELPREPARISFKQLGAVEAISSPNAEQCRNATHPQENRDQIGEMQYPPIQAL